MSSVSINFLSEKDLPYYLHEQVETLHRVKLIEDDLLCIALVGNHLLASCLCRHHRAHEYTIALDVLPAHAQTQLGEVVLIRGLEQLTERAVNHITVYPTPKQKALFNTLGFITRDVVQNDQSMNDVEPTLAMHLIEPAKAIRAYRERCAINTQVESRNHNEQITRQLSKDANGNLTFEDESTFLTAHRHLLMNSDRRVWILAESLENPIFCDRIITQQLQNIALAGRQAEIRILVKNDRRQTFGRNQIIALAQKLSSFIQIRTYKNVSYNVKQWVSIIDYDKCISRGIEHGFHGTAYAKNPLFNERMRHQFEDLWQQAQPSIEARRLAI